MAVADSLERDVAPLLASGGGRLAIKERVTIATPVSIDWEDYTLYDGFTTARGGEDKVLLVRFPRVDGWLMDDFRQAVVALIDLAEAILSCAKVVVCVDRQASEVHALVHALMYVGFALVDFAAISASLCEAGEAAGAGRDDAYVFLEYATDA